MGFKDEFESISVAENSKANTLVLLKEFEMLFRTVITQKGR